MHVCDFGEGRAEHTEITLGQVEECKKPPKPGNWIFMLIVSDWQAKPPWVEVRWMYEIFSI